MISLDLSKTSNFVSEQELSNMKELTLTAADILAKDQLGNVRSDSDKIIGAVVK